MADAHTCQHPEYEGDRAGRGVQGLSCGKGMSALVLLAAAGLGLLAPDFAGAAGDAEPKPPSSEQEFYHQFKGNPQKLPGWELTGPGAEKCVRFEPDGLRITLPTGRRGSGPNTGLSTGITVKGDFEITMGFEILQGPEPADAGPRPTPLTLLAVVDRPEFTVAGLSRRVAPSGETDYTAWTTLKDKDTGEPAGKFKAFPTTSRAGRLRLVRTGSEITYYVSEAGDGEFTFLQAHPFSDEDLKDVRITANTGGPKAALDVRVTELRIRAAAPGNLPGTAPASGATAGPSRSRWKIWLAGAIVGLMVVLSLGAWLYVRRGRHARIAPVPAVPPVETEPADKPESAAAIACRCPGCGKGLKARAQLAGRTVKCPQCGQGVLVPGIQGEGARHSPG